MRFGPVLAAVGPFPRGTRHPARLQAPPDRRGVAVDPPGAAPAAGLPGPDPHRAQRQLDARPDGARPRATRTRRSPWSRGWSRTSASTCCWPSSQSSRRWCRSCGSTSSATARSGSGSRRWPPSWGCADVVTFHGYQPDKVRDELLQPRLADHEHLAPRGLGPARSSRRPPTVCRRWRCACRGCATRWSTAARAGSSTRSGSSAQRRSLALRELADEDRAREITEACQAWARCFTWDRSAEPARRRAARGRRDPRSAPGTARPAATWASSPSSTGRATWPGRSPTRRCGRPTRWRCATAGSACC